ncbi:hypothetical protein [Amycolatopsis kentuckyensis]|uniref:hypothetical protein n=1 Tax=Amycolatopsis kentuckyensis TaxID=218823 RepID=UPI0011778D8E|nr:hypothetical protein [Amycolatopsis kentuckyensis]
MHSAESRAALAAGKEEFGTDGGYLGVRPAMPVSCYRAAAATVAAGVVAAFATGAALVAAAHHFGGHYDSGCESTGRGRPIGDGSVRDLIGARVDALQV